MSSGVAQRRELAVRAGTIPCGPSTSISTPAASSSSGLIRLSLAEELAHRGLRPALLDAEAGVLGAEDHDPLAALAGGERDGVFMAVANVRRIPSASPFSCWASWRGRLRPASR